MDRRDTIKSLLVGSIAGGLILSACKPDAEENTKIGDVSDGQYGRTEKEKAHDLKVMGESFFNEHEVATIAVLCDLILPASSSAGSAVEAGVPEFISFIAKDIQSHQLPLRGGMMWLDHEATKRFNQSFIICNGDQQKEILDTIAYPEAASPELTQGVKFLNLMRNLVLTGYYTSRMGLDDLGYQGNTPNVWDGVPADVLAKHGLAYEPEWLAKCIDQEKRAVIAEWDDQANLIN